LKENLILGTNLPIGSNSRFLNLNTLTITKFTNKNYKALIRNDIEKVKRNVQKKDSLYWIDSYYAHEKFIKLYKNRKHNLIDINSFSFYAILNKKKMIFHWFPMKVTLEQIVIAGIHLGHPTRYWQPKIAIYTYGIRNDTHLIDLVKTRRQLKEAQKFVIKIRREGKSILFVGTKDQAAEAIKERALASQSFFVNKHWLGGILTNWSTVKVSLSQLYRLEREQKEGAWSHKKKKEVSRIEKRLNSLTRYFDGLKGLQSLPDVVILVGQTTEIVAIRECRKLGIPVICRLDTDCNPDLVEVGVPINDDSERSIRLFLEIILPRIHEGRRQRALK
jgi:small subunit ribosomal protein S2